MERYYVFNPGTGKFLNWEGNWTAFSGAKDFMSMVEVRRACEKLSPTIVRFVFRLVHDLIHYAPNRSKQPHIVRANETCEYCGYPEASGHPDDCKHWESQ